jgi:hypothetical protein
MTSSYNRLIKILPVLFCFVSALSFGSPKDSLVATALYPFGRTAVSANGELELVSSAVHFGFKFHGTGFSIYTDIPNSPDHNYLQYTLDGVYQKRVRITTDNTMPFSVSGLKNGSHTVWIYKATEAATGPVFIKKILAHDIVAIKVPQLPVVEFIGNSITCGAAADPSEIPCSAGEYFDHHNAYYAYGPRVARALHMNYILSSVSGIGIYRNWNSLAPVMPDVYEKTDFQVNSTRNWDFKTYHPRIVSIGLGTNDFSDGDGKNPRLPFDSSVFVSNCIRFVALVKSKYPGALIILLSSPMLNGNKREKLQSCLQAVKMQTDKSFFRDKPVTLFFFKPMQARGCSGHPNVEDHAILADELIPVFLGLKRGA